MHFRLCPSLMEAFQNQGSFLKLGIQRNVRKVRPDPKGHFTICSVLTQTRLKTKRMNKRARGVERTDEYFDRQGKDLKQCTTSDALSLLKSPLFASHVFFSPSSALQAAFVACPDVHEYSTVA